jgi:hypothetical protein
MSALEWRARWFSDPVDRLQFLRRTASGPGKPFNRWTRVSRHLPALVVLGLAATVVASFFHFSPHATASAHSAPAPTRTTPRQVATQQAAQPVGSIWLVKNTAQFDLYSNGLRIESQFAASTAPRQYLAFSRSSDATSAGQFRSDPAGIVFHTTESHIAPFQEDQNQTLQRAGEGLLEFVNRTRAYHFVIDRFGRVFRVVRETDYANHAGNSIWADDTSVYINLNQSFLGVAFEARSTYGAGDLPLTEAQVHAGRVLTDMLRARFQIQPGNCVAHAQVSVNPDNSRAGYHVDWAANLPFGALGLANNYEEPLASVALFGFEADEALAARGGAPLAIGIAAAEAQLARSAALQGVSAEIYRRTLQRRYRDAIRALRGNAAHPLTRNLSRNPPQEYN